MGAIGPGEAAGGAGEVKMNRRDLLKMVGASFVFWLIGRNQNEVIFERQPIETLARWWNTLNYWDWPSDLPGKPIDFDTLPHISWGENAFVNKQVRSKYLIIGPICDEIEKIIGTKECLRWHNLHNRGLTDAEFESWWITTHRLYN